MDEEHEEQGEAENAVALLERQVAGMILNGTSCEVDVVDNLEHQVLTILRKVSWDDLKTTFADRFAAVNISDVMELEKVIRIMFGEAWHVTPDLEAYIDLVYTLRSRYPELPSERGARPLTFRIVVLNACQAMYEGLSSMSSNIMSAEGWADFETKFPMPSNIPEVRANQARTLRKRRLLASIRLIAHIIFRERKVRTMVLILNDLLGDQITLDNLPEEVNIEGCCELLRILGPALNDSKIGSSWKLLMSEAFSRLMALKDLCAAGTTHFVYSASVRYQIQDLIELSANLWVKKVLTIHVVTKEPLKLELTNIAGDSIAVDDLDPNCCFLALMRQVQEQLGCKVIFVLPDGRSLGVLDLDTALRDLLGDANADLLLRADCHG